MNTSSTDKPVKVNLGFHGGQVLSVRVKPEDLTALRGLLEAGSGWHELTAETGQVLFDVAKLDYLLVDDESHRVGF